jgi:urease accessory protein
MIMRTMITLIMIMTTVMRITGTITAIITSMMTTSIMAIPIMIMPIMITPIMTMRIMITPIMTTTITTMRMARIAAAGMTINMIMITSTIMATTRMPTAISMAEPQEFQRLHWFSPAFPVGGYAYSHGIEKAVETGDITGGESLAGWIDGILRLGAGRNDAILLAEAWRLQGGAGQTRQQPALLDLAELGMALCLSQERRLETAQQGAAFFALVASSWPHPAWPGWPDGVELPYPVAVGIAGAVHGQPLQPLISAYLQAFATNLLAAGIRLAVIGQNEAQTRLAGFMPTIAGLAAEAPALTVEDLGGMAMRGDLMSLRHETQTTRLFRS